jgi:cellulose synthase/poly-beta-1,6-N-acetylglucosamine synthase-like glycosyltransferase
MTLPVIVFATSLAICIYVYAGYPVLLYLLSRLRTQRVQRADIEPSVSIIIPVHNEASVIDAKLQNTFDLDYPSDRFEVVVVSDGSKDRTHTIVRRFNRVRLVTLPRRGKVHALNHGVRRASGEVLVFTDANTLLTRSSLRALIRNFADPDVGGVCGNYRIGSLEDATGRGESLYWRFEKWQKRLESRIGSVIGANGALYAIRKSLYQPIEDGDQADDLAISSRVVLQHRRLVFDRHAIAVENEPRDSKNELRRKIRVTHHSLRALLGLEGRLWRSGFYSFELVSHKLLRYLVPVFLLALYVSNVVIADAHPFFGFALLAQMTLYATAASAQLLQDSGLSDHRFLALPYYFCLVNAAALAGLVSVLRGQRMTAWTPRLDARTFGK